MKEILPRIRRSSSMKRRSGTFFFIDEEIVSLGLRSSSRKINIRSPMPRRLTLQLIADQLGCSAKTVSNAFNRPDQLSAAMRERVLSTGANMGYPGPNPLAASLRRGEAGARR